MKPSKVCASLGMLAGIAAAASAVMIIVSSIYYLFSGDGNGTIASTPGSSQWLVLTGFGWMKAVLFFAITGILLSIISSQFNKSELKQEAERRAQAQAARDRDAAAANDVYRQDELRRIIDSANSTALRFLDTLPDHLDGATRHLQQAEFDWKDRAPNPFWTQIENCAYKLACFDKAISEVHSAAQQYNSAIQEYRSPAPPFAVTDISVESMTAYNGAANIMAAFTRQAHKDQHFSTIFELWRGNKISEAGFSSLRSAIDDMSYNISNQISSLGSSVMQLSSAIDFQTSQVASAIEHQTSMADFHHREIKRANQDSRRHEKQIADRLWNIERGYKPLL